ncbi:MAG TPA: hypothetical protein VL588_07470 [Bdellovibrionota bacterium]|nr:hypothetical protein [Bdellovibrionota bacterium]
MKKLIPLILIVAAGLWIWWGRQAQNHPAPESGSAERAAPARSDTTGVGEATPLGAQPGEPPLAGGPPMDDDDEPPTEEADDGTPNEAMPKFTGRLEAPPVQNLRDEVAKDPHGTPPSLLRYAAQMADRMEAAFQSPEEADRLYPELEDCVKDPGGTVTQTVKLTCYVNALRLSRRYGKRFEGRADALAQASPGTAKMAHATGLDQME